MKRNDVVINIQHINSKKKFSKPKDRFGIEAIKKRRRKN